MIHEYDNKSFQITFKEDGIKSPIFANTPNGRRYADNWVWSIMTNDNGIREWKTHVFNPWVEYQYDLETEAC
jgi:hypothetical protein